MMAKLNTKPAKLQKPTRQMHKVLKSVSQVLGIQHVPAKDALWTWGQPSLPHVDESKTIHVAIWNIWKQNGGDQFRKEFSQIALGADLFLCQEALLTLQDLSFFVSHDHEATHGATYRRRDGCRDGVLTLAKYPQCEAPIRVVSATSEPLFKTTKAALVTYYPLAKDNNKKLAVINLHATLLRRPQTADLEMRRIIEPLEQHDGPAIVAGDFNTFSNHYLDAMSASLEMLGFKHAAISHDPRVPTARLDQAFYRGLNLLEIRVDTSYRYSDHFPILCKFTLLGE
jgi:endonuclease/exonuclease/phosphatase (EEP) superfamily protein YafD